MFPGMKPAEGRSCPDGGENLKVLPFSSGRQSMIGLNESLPENARAVTICGDARKFIVKRLPSLRALKFLLCSQINDATTKPSDRTC